jgi:hypothetical protein
LIYEYETKLRESDDPKEKAYCERELNELRRLLDDYEQELEEMNAQ